MNLILLDENDLVAKNRARVGGRRHEHLISVLRVVEGQRLRVGMLGGNIGSGTVESIRKDEIHLQLDLDLPPPSALPVELILAAPRPRVFSRVLRQCTTLGIKRIWLIGAWRVEKSYWSSPLLSPEKIDRQIRLGLEQAVDTVAPVVTLHPRFRPFVEDVIPTLLKGQARWLADPGGEEISEISALETPALLAIGPEGGWNDFERELLLDQGFHLVSAGPRVLKVEEAVPYLLGRLLR